MTRQVLLLVLLTCPLIATLGCQAFGTPHGSSISPALAPTHVLGDDGHIRRWVVLGPFPNETAAKVLPDGTSRAGYGKDYLEELGGEALAVFTVESAVDYIDEQGASLPATARWIEANDDGMINLDKHYNLDRKVAYAFTYIRSDRDQTMECFFGSDDCAKVWVNGKLLHAKWVEGGQSCRPRQDHFTVQLREGLNRMLVKVEDNQGEWGFITELLTQDKAEVILAGERRLQTLRDFQDVEVGPRIHWDYLIRPGAFPEVVWKQPYLVKSLWGELPLSVRWFDAQLNEVAAAGAPGRYTAYVESQVPDGPMIRRAFTIFCSEAGWMPWLNPLSIPVPALSTATIDQSVWNEQQPFITDFTGQQFMEMLSTRQEGAILLAGLSELKPLGRPATQLDLPPMRHQDHQLALKRKILAIEDDRYPELQLPHRKNGSASTVLHPGEPREAGVKPDAAERIREVCQQWYENSKEPFTVLVARRGVIVIHEAFGSTPERPVDLDTRFPLASLTKMFSALLFAQFLDQGLIDVDDPLGKYLPGFPTGGENTLTLRHCLTHTSGLEGHGNWGGMNNPWLDNVIANGAEALRPGKVAVYNGMGYDLAGKVMEIVSGKSIFRLFHENFFTPLGLQDPSIADLAYGMDCTVSDLAKTGQLLLNRGSYGETVFFSPGTFDLLMPRTYEDIYPDLKPADWNYGLGLMWMRHVYPSAGLSYYDADECVLSRNTIGHGAASYSVLRVDLENDLVVAMSRSTAGPEYAEFFPRFLRAIVESLE